MRTTTFGVHLGLSYHSISFSSTHELQALLRIVNYDFIESLYVYAILLVFMNE
jgi:hypothetical protein